MASIESREAILQEMKKLQSYFEKMSHDQIKKEF